MPNPEKRWVVRWIAAGVLAVGLAGAPVAQERSQAPSSPPSDGHRAVINSYCLSCHNSKAKAGGFELDAINTQDVGDHAEAWEKVVRKLRARQMPTSAVPRARSPPASAWPPDQEPALDSPRPRRRSSTAARMATASASSSRSAGRTTTRRFSARAISR